MSISSKLMVAAAGATVFVCAASPVLATEDTGARQTAPVREDLQTLRTTVVADRCKIATDRLAEITSRYEGNKQVHIDNYRKIVGIHQQLIADLKAKGYDTSKLEADSLVLNQKILDFGNAYAAWMAQLTVAKQYSCGESEGKFKEEMAKARPLAEAVRQAALAIRTYFINTIKPDLQALRVQKRNAVQTQ